MKPRPIRIEGDVAYVPLTRGYEAIIDAPDVPLVADYNWFAVTNAHSKTVYASRTAKPDSQGRRARVYMHRAILAVSGHQPTDHANRNGLDNRRSNLRVCTPSQNAQNRRSRSDNTSGCKGVYWRERLQKWRAQITLEGQWIGLGHFDTKEQAAEAYAIAARQYFGPFAHAGRRNK